MNPSSSFRRVLRAVLCLAVASAVACQMPPPSDSAQEPGATEATSHPLTRENGVATVQDYEREAWAYLKEWASDEARYFGVMDTCFGSDHYRSVSSALRGRMLNGDFSWLSRVEIVAPEVLKGFPAAYLYNENVVLMSSAVPAASRSLLYLEEVGHQFDVGVRRGDSPGDEGELFRRLVLGETLSADEVGAIRASDDMDQLMWNGRLVSVEFFFVTDWAKEGYDAARGGARWVWKGAVGGWEATVKTAQSVGAAIEGAANAAWDGAQWLRDQGVEALKAQAATLEHVYKTRGAPFVVSRMNTALNSFKDAGFGSIKGARSFGRGLDRIAHGDFKGGVADVFGGLAQIALAQVDAGLLRNIEGLQSMQTLLGLEPPGRALTAHEIQFLRAVFDDTLPYSSVVVKEGPAFIFSLNARPFTLRNTIYMKKKPASDRGLLAHECTHVWQYYRYGAEYAREALTAQLAKDVDLGPGYNWTAEFRTKRWQDMNPEQQGKFVHHAYDAGFFHSGDAFFTAPKYETAPADHNDFAFDAWNTIACPPTYRRCKDGMRGPQTSVVTYDTQRELIFARGPKSNPVMQVYDGAAWSGWWEMGGSILSAPVAIRYAPDTTMVVARGMDHCLYAGTVIGYAWQGWKQFMFSRPGDASSGCLPVRGRPALASWGPGRVDLAVQGWDGQLLHAAADNGVWVPQYNDLGGQIIGDPALVSWGAERLDFFVRAWDNSLQHKAWTPAIGFTGFYSLGGIIHSSPSVASWASGRLDIAVLGADNGLFHHHWDSRWGWGGFHYLGGIFTARPELVTRGYGHLDFFGRGLDNGLWHRAWSDAVGFTAYRYLGGVLRGAPNAVPVSINAVRANAVVNGDLYKVGGNGANFWLGSTLPGAPLN